MKTLLFPLFLVAFVLIIQALDQSYQKENRYLKLQHPEFMHKNAPIYQGFSIE